MVNKVLEASPGESWRALLQNVRRMRIRAGQPALQPYDPREVFADLSGDALPLGFLERLEFSDQPARTYECACDISMELYAEGKRRPVATIGLVHGVALRWRKTWRYDALLAPGEDKRLCEWLAQHGARAPLDDLLAYEARVRAEQSQRVRATEGFSPELKAAFKKGGALFATELERFAPELGERLALLFQILGSSNKDWSVFFGTEIDANKLLVEAPRAALAEACQAALLGSHRIRRRGAARFWKSWQSPLEQWDLSDPTPLWRAVLDIQQQARYQPLRIQAAALLSGVWRTLLPTEERDGRLLTLMHDPDADVRRRSMLSAGIAGANTAVPILLDVLSGKPLEVRPLTPVPDDESADVDPRTDAVADRCPEYQVAALALAYLRYEPARSRIAALAPSPMVDVALALLGDLSRLRAEHFGIDRPRLGEGNQALQLAAVEAVARGKGRRGLEWAMRYQQVSHWWEIEWVATKLSAMLIEQGAPASDMLADCKTIEKLAAWYDQHGATYLANNAGENPH